MPRPGAAKLGIENLLIVRLAPFGFEDQLRMAARTPLFATLPPRLFSLAHASGELNLKINPAFMRLGASIDLQPLNLLRIRAGYDRVRYFGQFGYPRAYGAPTWDFLEDLREPVSRDAGYETRGSHVYFEPSVAYAARRLVVQAKLGLERWDVPLRDGATVFFDPQVNTLVPADGWVRSMEVNLVRWGGRLSYGLNYQGVWPQYAEPAAVGMGPTSRHRVGPLAAWSWRGKRPWSVVPTLVLLTGVYLDDIPEGSPGRGYAVLVFTAGVPLLQ